MLIDIIRLKHAMLFVLLASTIWAQGGLGGISGSVRDESGAVVEGAVVTAEDAQTRVRTATRSQADGHFTLPLLQTGTYRLIGERQGFKRLVIDGLKISVDTVVTQDVVLRVGTVAESVEVKGETSLVETTSGAVGTTVQVTHVLEMPLVDRNLFNLVNLVPGSFTSGGDVSIGGGRLQSALAMVDGVNNTRGGLGVTNVEMAPPVDSMQEFKVEVSGYGAELGHSAAGVVNAVTKSGTNNFHGSFYEFLRNDKLDARGWAADSKPPLRRNNYGGTIGGPIRRNRTFFFFNLDGLRVSEGVTKTRSVGLPAWRSGDFSTLTRDAGGRAAPVVVYDPATGTGSFTNPIATTPFPNNIIPPNRLDPVAIKAVAYLPSPNRTPDNPFNQSGNWQENTVNTTTRDYYTTKVDHELTAKTRMFARYILSTPEDTLTGYAKGFGVADPDGLLIHNRRQNLALNATHLFSATRFLNVTAGFNRVYIHRGSGDCCDTNYASQLGLPNLPGEVFPRFNFNGGTVGVGAIGAAGNANRIATFTNFDYIANFTEVHGAHTLKFGVQFSTFNGNDLSRTSPSGVWSSNGQYTRGVQPNGAVIANTGANLADFMIGRLNSITVQVSPGIGKRIQYYGGYLQDDWRVTPRLTLNLGLRYETETPAYEVAGRTNNFNPYKPNPLAGTGDIPAGAMGVVDFPNRNSNDRYLWNWNKLNFAPRFGFAWRVFGTNDTVVRGGFGIFFGNQYDRQIIQEQRNGFDTNYQGRFPLSTTLSQGIPANALNPIPESALVPTFGTRGTAYPTSVAQYLDPYRKTPYSENFNLTVQHQWKGTLFEVGGLGNLGRQLTFGNININHIRPELLSRTDIPERLRRPITVLDSDQAQVQILSPNWGISNYLAFTFKSERRYSRGLGWTVAYTFTRWIDNLVSYGTPNGDNDQIQNIFNIAGEKSASTNNAPHRLVLSPIFELPFGKNRKWLQSGLLGRIAGGWQLAGLATLQSGSPFGVTVLNGPLNYLGDNSDGTILRADVVSSNLMSGNAGAPAIGVRGKQWLNPDAFAIPARYTFGNSSRTLPGVNGPGFVSVDAMLARNIGVGERWRAQLRWEAFNLANTPRWGTPNDTVGGASLGTITSAGGRRILQLGAKIYW